MAPHWKSTGLEAKIAVLRHVVPHGRGEERVPDAAGGDGLDEGHKREVRGPEILQGGDVAAELLPHLCWQKGVVENPDV